MRARKNSRPKNHWRDGRKGQSSVEYLLVVAFLLIIIMPVGYLALGMAADQGNTTQAQVAANAVAASADQAAVAGEGSRVEQVIYFPPRLDANATLVSGKEVNLRVITTNGFSDAFAVSRANLTGTLPTREGRAKLRFTLLSSGIVNISRVV